MLGIVTARNVIVDRRIHERQRRTDQFGRERDRQLGRERWLECRHRWERHGLDASAAETSVERDSSASDATSIGDAKSRPVKPSAGCGKMNPPMGNRTIMTGGQTGTFIVDLPAGYSATTPMPLGFGFHGFGNKACLPPQGECRASPI